MGMKASTRRWVMLSALGLLALDLGTLVIAAPRAQDWLGRARASSLVRAGAAAVRNLERAGSRGVEEASYALLTRVMQRSGGAYAFIVDATPAMVARTRAHGCTRAVRVVSVEAVEAATVAPCAEAAASAALPDGPAPAACPACPACPSSPACPKAGTRARAAGTSTIGLPISALGVTVD
jgi:hypothetical protein